MTAHPTAGAHMWVVGNRPATRTTYGADGSVHEVGEVAGLPVASAHCPDPAAVLADLLAAAPELRALVEAIAPSNTAKPALVRLIDSVDPAHAQEAPPA